MDVETLVYGLLAGARASNGGVSVRRPLVAQLLANIQVTATLHTSYAWRWAKVLANTTQQAAGRGYPLAV